jgi:phosphate transport system substrate-binding protein
VQSAPAGYQDVLAFESAGADLGGVDLPLAVPQLVAKGLVQFPVAVGGVVPIVNLPGIVPGALHLSGPVLAAMFLGEIRVWNDPALTALNPSLALPSLAVRPVHPLEPSGTTYVFTSYLGGQSRAWKAGIGAGLTVSWPTGEGRPDARAVAREVQKTSGALGYADYGLAAESGLGKPALQNREGQFVAPTVLSFQAAAMNAAWQEAPAFALSLVDQAGAGSWPLTAPTFALFPLHPRSADRARATLRFLDWGLRSAGSTTSDAGYVPLPVPVVTLVEAAWKRQIKDAAGRPLWNPAP